MNKLLFFLSVLLCLVSARSIAQKPGDLSWALLTDPSPGYDTIHSIKVQPDGKIVAAGNSYKGPYMAIAIGRYDGAKLDSSFGINGIVTTSLDSAYTTANAVAIQPDGKIVVAGGYKKGFAIDFILERYNQDGSTDSSFGMNGRVWTDFGSYDAATALAIQADGKIVAAGQWGPSLALCRYNTDGSLDSSFNSNGKLTVPIAGANCMNLQTDGKIVVCCGNLVLRLMPDGSPDSSFGTNAIATLAHDDHGVGINFLGMAIQKDGKILCSGSDGDFVIERLDTAGIPDNSFGNGGVVKTTGFLPFSSYHVQVAAWVSVQADGRIIAGGWALACTLGQCRPFAIARYLSNGVIDSSFGNYGKVVTDNPYFYTANSFSAAINNNDQLVVAGTNNESFYYPSSWALATYDLGPMLGVHTVQGVNGEITVAPNPAGDLARIQSTHIKNGTWHLTLCDLTGRTLHSETVVVTNNAFDKSISLIGLPAAMYLVKLDNSISTMTAKLMKSR